MQSSLPRPQGRSPHLVQNVEQLDDLPVAHRRSVSELCQIINDLKRENLRLRRLAHPQPSLFHDWIG